MAEPGAWSSGTPQRRPDLRPWHTGQDARHEPHVPASGVILGFPGATVTKARKEWVRSIVMICEPAPNMIVQQVINTKAINERLDVFLSIQVFEIGCAFGGTAQLGVEWATSRDGAAAAQERAAHHTVPRQRVSSCF